jgi:hypothetical protein
LLYANPLIFADGHEDHCCRVPLSRACIAIGMPIDKDGVFFGEQGDPVAVTNHGIHPGGPMVDHYELDFIAGNPDGLKNLMKRSSAIDGVQPTAISVGRCYFLQ